MTSVKNELPVAVHQASGGGARVRYGGTEVWLAGTSSGSFQVEDGTRYRIFLNFRTSTGMLLLVGYTSPPTMANSSLVGTDLKETIDDVPKGTTVYYVLISPMTGTPITGGADDYLYVSYYK